MRLPCADPVPEEPLAQTGSVICRSAAVYFVPVKVAQARAPAGWSRLGAWLLEDISSLFRALQPTLASPGLRESRSDRYCIAGSASVVLGVFVAWGLRLGERQSSRLVLRRYRAGSGSLVHRSRRRAGVVQVPFVGGWEHPGERRNWWL